MILSILLSEATPYTLYMQKYSTPFPFLLHIGFHSTCMATITQVEESETLRSEVSRLEQQCVHVKCSVEKMQKAEQLVSVQLTEGMRQIEDSRLLVLALRT